MPTAPTTPKAKAKAAKKPASAKAITAKTTSARRSTAGTTQAKASHAKGARTRAVHASESAVRQAQTATKETADVFGDYAERAVLIPVGAALIARERIVSTVSDTVSTYSSPTKTQAQLRKFERRGATARNRLEREVRKARVRVERELRQRRSKIESTVSELEERRDAIAKSGGDLANRVPDIANKVQERILSLV
ncbi:MAG: hypothetical protein ABR992_13525 [Solirubrobacteraceae bacterium]|jgi:hypothetical protein